jgi:hypothetical protein
MIARRALPALLGLLPLPLAAEQPPPLSEAQLLLFETPHLIALQPPLRLDYAFLREEAGHPPVEDTIRLTIRAGEAAGRRDVEPEFLTGPRAIHYPTATGFRGNPLLLFALDRIARELSAATGGSHAWFRNRIRQALMQAAPPRHVMLPFEGREAEAVEIELRPFTGEPRARRYQDQRYRFVLAEAVPGWIQAIDSDLPARPEGGEVRETIRFAAAVPL